MSVRFKPRVASTVEVSIIAVEECPEVPEGPPDLDNDCLKAIEAWVNGFRLGTLMIVHRENGAGFELVRAEMVGDDGELWQLHLMGSNSLELRPRFGRRENEKYRPIWR